MKRGRRLVYLGLVLMAALAAPALAASFPHRSGEHIIGGTKAKPGTWKFTAWIVHKTGFQQYSLCTGTIVSSNVILTAAHCNVDEETGHVAEPGSYRVYTGSINPLGGNARISRVSRIVNNRHYNSFTNASDIALLVLSHPITSPRVRLAGAGDRALEKPSTPAYIAGWGDLHYGQTGVTRVLRWAPTRLQRAAYCDKQAPFPSSFSSSRMLCTQNSPQNNTATCQGDSGGPLVAMSAGQPVQIGVTDFGYKGCLTKHPSYFARVSAFRSWIQGWINRVAP